MKKLKIAILVNAFWNSGAGISGGDQRVMQIFSRLADKFIIDIYTSPDGKKVIEPEIKSAEFILSPENIERGNVLIRYCRRNRWLKKKLMEREYDVVYSSSDFFPDVLPARKFKAQHPEAKWIACIFHIYPNFLLRPGNKIINLIGSAIQRASFKKIRKLADRTVNINYQVRDKLARKYRFDINKIAVNPCGIDLEYFDRIRVAKNYNQAVFLARLVPSKGIFDLPLIWRKVLDRIPGAGLKIVGGGSRAIKNKLKTAFAEAGVARNVQILGFLENDRAYKILKESALLIFPSHEEGFGIVIAESFACGVPIVAWDLPVYKEVFGETVVTVKLGDIDQFAEEVARILKSKPIQKALAGEGKKGVGKYSWKEIAAQELKIISAT